VILRLTMPRDPALSFLVMKANWVTINIAVIAGGVGLICSGMLVHGQLWLMKQQGRGRVFFEDERVIILTRQRTATGQSMVVYRRDGLTLGDGVRIFFSSSTDGPLGKTGFRCKDGKVTFNSVKSDGHVSVFVNGDFLCKL
jgi:hypothetical protein